MTRSSGAIGGAAAMRRQRIVRDTANSFYVVAKNLYGTAWAHHFIRNLGGADSSDTGGVWPCWRYVGTAELPGYGSNPKNAASFTYSDDSGAQDYAIAAPSGQYLGSYHGGDAISLSMMTMDGHPIDPTIAEYEGRQFALRHVSSATNGGNSYTIELVVTVRPDDGNLAFAAPQLASNVATFTKPFVGMVIGSGIWDELAVTLQSGAAIVPVPIPIGTTYTLNSWHVAMRQSGSGRVIRIKGNHPQHGWFRRTRTVRTASRIKFYFEGTGNVSLNGRHNIHWTVEFEMGGASGVMAALPANLISNGDFTSDLSGWSATQTATGGNIVQAGGKARFNRGTAGDSRLIQGIAGLEAGGLYLLTGEDTTSGGALGSMGLTSNSNGSTSSPSPAFAPDANDGGGYNARLVMPTLATQYVMLKQDSGVAGQITDFDNIGLYRLAGAARSQDGLTLPGSRL